MHEYWVAVLVGASFLMMSGFFKFLTREDAEFQWSDFNFGIQASLAAFLPIGQKLASGGSPVVSGALLALLVACVHSVVLASVFTRFLNVMHASGAPRRAKFWTYWTFSNFLGLTCLCASLAVTR